MAKEAPHKILVLDDETGWLDMCREILAQLPSNPEIHTASSGMDALSQLDTGQFQVLICDLFMPQMDGLEVLDIVRRRFPGLRTVVLTGHPDEALRSRAYALGVDLYWLKSDLQPNLRMFLECLESLLGMDDEGGFRDAQTRSMVDVFRMQMASHNSSLLRIRSAGKTAQVWFQRGEMVDVQAEGADGEVAFARLMKWKGGTYESLPPESNHIHNIHKSLEALLFEMDQSDKRAEAVAAGEGAETKFIGRMIAMSSEGADFVLTVPVKKENTAEGCGSIPDSERLADWARQTEKAAQRLSAQFGAGPLTYVAGHNVERHLLLLPRKQGTLVVGWPPKVDPAELFEKSKKLAETWAS